MIPVPDNVLTKINFNEIAKTDINYANLLRAEHKYCSSHVNDIQAKAIAVYKIGVIANINCIMYAVNLKL